MITQIICTHSSNLQWNSPVYFILVLISNHCSAIFSLCIFPCFFSSSTRCWCNSRQERRSRISPSCPSRCPSVCSCGDCQDAMNFWLRLVSHLFPTKNCRTIMHCMSPCGLQIGNCTRYNCCAFVFKDLTYVRLAKKKWC